MSDGSLAGRGGSARVRAAGLKTAILSNGTLAMLAAGVGAAGVGGCMLSMEKVGAFKQDRRVWGAPSPGGS
jgi:2-haloacid dehalogenase